MAAAAIRGGSRSCPEPQAATAQETFLSVLEERRSFPCVWAALAREFLNSAHRELLPARPGVNLSGPVSCWDLGGTPGRHQGCTGRSFLFLFLGWERSPAFFELWLQSSFPLIQVASFVH